MHAAEVARASRGIAGLRLALAMGASSSICYSSYTYGMRTVVVGAAIGLMGALLATCLFSHLLFQVSRTDWVTFLD